MKVFGLIVLGCGITLAYGQSPVKAQTKGTTPPAKQEQAQSAAPAPAATEKGSSAGQDTAKKPSTGIDPAKEAAIRKLFEASAIRESMQQMLAASIDSAKSTLRNALPPGDYQGKLIDLFWERFQQKMKVDDLLEMLVPIYDKYFSMEDIEGLTKFYETPAGKKALSRLTQVMIECQAAGAKFGEQLGREAMIEVLAEHPDLQKGLEEAGARKN